MTNYCLVNRAARTIFAGPDTAMRLIGYVNGNPNIIIAAGRNLDLDWMNGDLAGKGLWPCIEPAAVLPYQTRVSVAWAADPALSQVNATPNDQDKEIVAYRTARKAEVDAKFIAVYNAWVVNEPAALCQLVAFIALIKAGDTTGSGWNGFAAQATKAAAMLTNRSALKTAITNAADAAAVYAVDITAGWPA